MQACPICSKHAAEKAHAPFCSDRCRMMDLNRWLSGHYAVPAVESEEEDSLPQSDSSEY